MKPITKRLCAYAPTAIVLGTATVVPGVVLAAMAFCKVDSGTLLHWWSFVGFDNFASALGESNNIRALWRTMYFAVCVSLAELSLGLALALWLHHCLARRGWVTALLAAPFLSSPVAMALLWKFLFALDGGLINVQLQSLGGGKIAWLSTDSILGSAVESTHLGGIAGLFVLSRGFWSAVMVDVWQWTPFVTIVLLARLEMIPASQRQAVAIDGGGRLDIFRYVVLPALAPSLGLCALIRVIDSLKAFDTFWIFFGNSASMSTVAIRIQQYGLHLRDYGVGGALSLIALALTIGIAGGVLFINRRIAQRTV